MKRLSRIGWIAGTLCILFALCLDSTAHAQAADPDVRVALTAEDDPILDAIAGYNGWNAVHSSNGNTIYIWGNVNGTVSVVVQRDSNGTLMAIDVIITLANGVKWEWSYRAPEELEDEEDQND